MIKSIFMNNAGIYTDQINTYSLRRRSLAARISAMSIVRLAFFLLFAWFVYRSFAARFAGYDMLYAFVALALLLVAVVISGTLKKRQQFIEKMILVNENEVTVNEGGLSFLDNGERYKPAEGAGADLNVFGRFSLYHLLNRTASASGMQKLATHLNDPFTGADSIKRYQQCVAELSTLTSFRQLLLANTLMLDEKESLTPLQEGIDRARFNGLTTGVWQVMAILWPCLFAVVAAWSAYKGSLSPLLLFMVIGLFILAPILKRVNLLYYQVSRRSYLYSTYARCFTLIGDQAFTHPYLRERQEEIRHASLAFRKLARLTGLFDLRLSMFSIFINGWFLHDLLCARAYLRWNDKYQAQVKAWFAALGEWELLNSLATFHFNHPSYIFPEPVESDVSITARNMGHPLMRSGTSVTNDISLGRPSRLHLVSGSNMSGKSTFLRTLGLNLLLARAGAPVFASEFRFRPVRLLTSFHHIDSLEGSTSYFYAELKSLQNIVQSLDAETPALVLLDEVMRGTNSKDKHDGTALLIKKLLSKNCIALIATHDTELSVLADQYPGLIENHSFESEIRDGELHFDFTRRDGVAQSRNATFLMKKMGIVDE